MDKLPKDVTLIVLTSIFLFTVAAGIIILVLIYQKRQLQYLREKEDLKSSFQKELLTTQLEIQEQTLKNISQEIHDNIGQVLSLAKLNLSTIEFDSSPQGKQKIDHSKTLIAKAIQDLRDLSKGLNTDYVTEMGLARSIEYEVEMVKKTGLFDTSFQILGTVHNLGSQKELIIFRIFQEIINNIIKHAESTAFTVVIQYHPALFTLTIDDNGSGFDLADAMELPMNKLGLGIRNMTNRAQMINAEFSIRSKIGAGTKVEIRLPF